MWQVKLGHGQTSLDRVVYDCALQVMHNHVVCAGKKLYDTLIEDGNEGAENMVQKYLQECQLMSSLRHPHITLFLGVCFLPSSRLPLLVMERLDTNLDDLLDSTPDLPLPVKCSVLEDVASGLLYLHERRPPIIHRDLTARNVLLTTFLVAKITDMGNSRIIDLKPGQLVRTLSQIPGTLVYMPPEALDDKHRYGPSLDIFSFGHLALFTILQVRTLVQPKLPQECGGGGLYGLKSSHAFLLKICISLLIA
jgi:serine/threonine protein kinase